MRKHQDRRLRDRKGAVMVITAVSLILLLGVTALAVDAGRLYRERRNTQAAADAAADAAGIALYATHAKYGGRDGDGTARASAVELASGNGYAPATVTVNIPPASGSFVGQLGYVEVIIDAPITRTFSSIFGKGDLIVTTRAVAGGTIKSSLASVMVLDPKRKDSLKLKGKNSVLEVAGDVIVNSSNKRAVKVDKKAQLIADHVLVAGGIDKKSKGLIDATVMTGVEPTPDPLASLPLPVKGTNRDPSQFKTSVGGQDVFNLPPGTYKELKFDKNDRINLSPGEYYVKGEISLKDNSSVNGSGVMIYSAGNKGAKFKTSGNITLSPPTSGAYRGVTLFQHGRSKSKIEFRNDKDLNLSGIIYAPNSEVKFKNTDLEFDEDWESESEDYALEEDGGVSVAGSLSASIICRKLSIAKGSHVRLRGADINAQRPVLGLVE